MSDDIKSLKAKRDKLKRIAQLKEELPHLYAFERYKWQEDFWQSLDTFQFQFKANQIGGSSIFICKLIHWATEPKLWEHFARTPKMFIFLQPDKGTLTREYETKWKEYLPKGSMKDHPQYGWTDEWEQSKYISVIRFNSGINIYMKTYGGSGAGDHVQTLQSSTASIICCDEELPESLWPELRLRIASPANKGSMFWMNATPTRGQRLWQQLQNGEVKLPDARVNTATMYDCLYYANGKKSLWTEEHIEKIKQSLPSEREIQIRVYGLFRKGTDTLAITQFKREKHVKPFHPINGWEYYAGIDYGVGGKTGHPSAIGIIAVSPNYNAARLMKCWRGDDEQTTPDDVINKFLEMKSSLGISDMAGVYYDHSCGAMGIISERAGLGFQKANKDREYGFNLINSLFKNDMLIIMDDKSGEPDKLIDELESLASDHDKKRAGDDLIDGALRYALSSIPFNFENIKINIETTKASVKKFDGRQEIFDEIDIEDELGDEIDEWNSLY